MPFKTYLKFSLALLLVLVIPAKSVFAQIDPSIKFTTSYDTYYFFADDASTQVKQSVEIINKQKDVIPTSFTLIVKNINISDVQATDAKENLEIETASTVNETTIKALFDEQQIGVDKKNEINIIYKTNDLVNKIGKIYNISIPPVNEFETIEDYHVTLDVPFSYGKKLFLSPTPVKEEVKSNSTQYYFDKNSLESGISAAFGEYQLFDFNIKYHLKNNSVITSYQTVALPPEIEKYQQMNFKSIDPTPEYVTTDVDGNFIAHYKIAPKSEIHVNLIGQTKIIPFQFNSEAGGMFNEIPSSIKSIYTKPQKYWETDNKVVKDVAKSLKNQNLTVAENARLVYKEITSRLKYNSETTSDTISRRGAVNALTSDGTLACMEFTDAFIAVARAMGIPAREINGYAISTSKVATPVSTELSSGDLLHSWVEFYDPKLGWVQIDPTWGSTSGLDYFTKLDTNHITFVVKGSNSEQPLPAGAYRFDENEKQIDIKASEITNEIPELTDINQKIQISPNVGFNLIKYIQGFSSYQVTNNFGRKLYKINGENINIAPYESKTIYTKSGTKVTFTDFSGKVYTN